MWGKCCNKIHSVGEQAYRHKSEKKQKGGGERAGGIGAGRKMVREKRWETDRKGKSPTEGREGGSRGSRAGPPTECTGDTRR